MKNLATLVSLSALFLLASCTTPRPVELTVEDFAWAAEQTISQMFQTGCLDKPTGGRYVVVISRITNDTNQYIDTDLLTKKVRIAMLNSGKAVITTAVGLTGPEDKMSGAVRGLSEDANFNAATVAGQGEMIAPELSLSGKIIERRPNAGTDYATVEYYFQLTLTDVHTGLAIWEGEQQITK